MMKLLLILGIALNVYFFARFLLIVSEKASKLNNPKLFWCVLPTIGFTLVPFVGSAFFYAFEQYMKTEDRDLDLNENER